MRPSRPLVGRTAELEALALVSTAARPACGRSPSPASPASADPDIVSEAVSLAEYRAKYARYRSDKALRDLHAKFPTIAIWDDHEVQDNYAGDARGAGSPRAGAGRRPGAGPATRPTSRRCLSSARAATACTGRSATAATST